MTLESCTLNGTYGVQTSHGHMKFISLKYFESTVVEPWSVTCADPESFVRGGPTLTFFLFVFLFDEGREDPNTTISGAIIGPPAKRHLNGVLLACR